MTKQWADLTTALLGVLLGFSILYAVYGGQETVFEDLGLGGETSSAFLEYTTRSISIAATFATQPTVSNHADSEVTTMRCCGLALPSYMA